MRRFSPLLLLIVLAAVVPAGADVSTAQAVDRSANLWYDGWDPNTGGWRNGGLSMRAVTASSTTGVNATPTLAYEATAWVNDCSQEPCTGESFPWQVVQPTALSLDPLGNTVRMTATLISSAGVSKVFDVSMSRPSVLAFQGCHPTVVCGNAWYDPQSNSAAASGNAGLSRWAYQKVTGTFAGAPLALPAYPYGWVESSSSQNVRTAIAAP